MRKTVRAAGRAVATALLAAAAIGAVIASEASPASADVCFVARKPAGAGAAVIVSVATGDVTPNKPNASSDERLHGAFVTVTEVPGVGTVDLFVKTPEEAACAIPGAAAQAARGRGCDGRGLDVLSSCVEALVAGA